MSHEESEMIRFDKNDLVLFKKAYSDAVESDEYIFMFNGREYLVSYAKYVIEYLDNKLER